MTYKEKIEEAVGHTIRDDVDPCNIFNCTDCPYGKDPDCSGSENWLNEEVEK